jgi:carboxyl-terminal processing protease
MKFISVVIFIIMLISSAFAKPFTEEIFKDAVSKIKKESYYSLSDDEIYQAAIAGVLQHLEEKNKATKKEDSFNEEGNVLLPPKSSNEMQKELKGEVSGIGIGIKYDKKEGHIYPIVIDVIDNAGAKAAGIESGDQIIKIDGVSVTKFKSFREIVYGLRGKAGSTVKLGILRNGELLKKTVKRKTINWDAVAIKEKTKQHAVLKINYFNDKTVDSIKRELKSLKREGIRSLVIDLRDNSGGSFHEGLKALKLFTKKGETLLIAKYGNGKEEKFESSEDGIAKDFKSIILTSRKTKSMGEAFASAMSLLNGAKVIGEKTFGKGTVEMVTDLDNKFSMKFTIGRLFTKDHHTWDQAGVIPSVEVLASLDDPEQKDSSLELAKILLAK